MVSTADTIAYLEGRVAERKAVRDSVRFQSLTGYLALQTTIRELEQRIVELQVDALTATLHEQRPS